MNPATPITPAQEEQLWTAQQVATYLHVSRSWVYRETQAGRLPHTRILGLCRYDPVQIRAMKDRGQVAPARVIVPLTKGDKP